MRTLLLSLVVSLVAGTAEAKHHKHDEENGTGLASTTILVIRHAEKPADGPNLSEAGRKRAQAYVSFFQKLTLDGHPARPDAIFATEQSKSSNRPYETVQPLALALGLVVQAAFKDDQFAELAASLRSQSHGRTLLICWHHGMIPQLLQALGADPNQLLPDGKWPSDEFGWLLVLRFDAQGTLSSQQRMTAP